MCWLLPRSPPFRPHPTLKPLHHPPLLLQTPSKDDDALVLAAAAYQAMSATDSLSDNKEGLAEHGAIPSRSEAPPNTSGSDSNTIPKTYVATYPPIPSPLTCDHVSTVPEVASVGPVPVPAVANVGPVPVPQVANVVPVPDAAIVGTPQYYNATGHLVDSRARDLTAPWMYGMAST